RVREKCPQAGPDSYDVHPRASLCEADGNVVKLQHQEVRLGERCCGPATMVGTGCRDGRNFYRFSGIGGWRVDRGRAPRSVPFSDARLILRRSLVGANQGATASRPGVNALTDEAGRLTHFGGHVRLDCSSPLNYQTGNSMAGFNQLKLLAFYFA